MKIQDRKRLAIIVATGVTVRLFTLWIGRPEFTGWLNHTYYYYVQVRGLLADGALPYPDMPGLFVLYALIAKLLQGLGAGTETAIVASSRLVMIAAPSVIPLVVYRVAKNFSHGPDLTRTEWIVILSSGFLPLSVTYMPEFLQKNVVGLLLLFALVHLSQRLIERFDKREAWIGVTLAIAIVMTHFGTTVAMGLYGLSLIAATAILSGDQRKIVRLGAIVMAGGFLSLAIIYLLDPQRFGRIFIYLTGSFGNSILATALGDGERAMVAVYSLLVSLLIYIGLAFLSVAFLRQSETDRTKKIIWLSSIIFVGLLMLPIIDQQLMGRLVQFIYIPLLIVILMLGQSTIFRPKIMGRVVVLGALGLALMSVGELVSSKIYNANNLAITTDLRMIEKQFNFGKNDLIITKTGADHICNWFFGVKAGTITSLTVDDFKQYDRIYIFNPIEGGLDVDGLMGRSTMIAADKYFVMRKNILIPNEAEMVFQSEDIEITKLTEPPADWRFDESGRWIGYR